MIIRPAQKADGPAVIELVTTILSREFPTDQAVYVTEDLMRFSDTYQGPSNTFLVAEEDRQIVGTCGVKAESPQTAILRRLFVHPDYRKKGIGAGLLNEALQFCRSHGFKEIIIRTSTRMEQAIRLCRSAGFREEGRWVLGKITLIRFRLRLT